MTEIDKRIEKKQTTPCQVIGALNAIFYLFIYFFNGKNVLNFWSNRLNWNR